LRGNDHSAHVAVCSPIAQLPVNISVGKVGSLPQFPPQMPVWQITVFNSFENENYFTSNQENI